MNRLPTVRRFAVIVAGLAGALLALCTGPASAAFAVVKAPLGGDPHGRPGLPSAHPAAPAAFASGHPPLPPGHIHQPVHLPPIPASAHAVVSGGMPGWQIALIAVAAALAAAALAILVDRARTARKAHATTA